eukprot:TRINITY_DN34705_c0_g2_i1.p1 TRINITY_DN34705_c0_g2~~TRINITY_DN34705_c0_g2_i1.p1  ORF type:complete len:1003 (-),score=230.81 TRINITY_DN34705_c0_g2_i1:67-2952(-)
MAAQSSASRAVAAACGGSAAASGGCGAGASAPRVSFGDGLRPGFGGDGRASFGDGGDPCGGGLAIAPFLSLKSAVDEDSSSTDSSSPALVDGTNVASPRKHSPQLDPPEEEFNVGLRHSMGAARRRSNCPPLSGKIANSVDHVDLVHRIATLLASTAALHQASLRVFSRFAVDAGTCDALGDANDGGGGRFDGGASSSDGVLGAVAAASGGDPGSPGSPLNATDVAGKELPTSRLGAVFEVLRIPVEHTQLFWTVLKRDLQWEETNTPKAIKFVTFHSVLVKTLRRIRDIYCVRVSKVQLVMHNCRKLTDDYDVVSRCGAGSFGQCFWLTHKVTGKARVAKKIYKEGTAVPLEEVGKELDVLKHLDHPHIVRMFEWFESEDSFFVVMEAAYGGDLDKALRQAKADGCAGLAERTVWTLVEQCLRALLYIHSEGVIHRDLKPANMILAKQLRVEADIPHLMLADFGIAEVFLSAAVMKSERKGTWAYMAPELFMDQVSPKSDVWALGVVTFELLSGEKPFGVNPFEIHSTLCFEDDGDTVDISRIINAGCSDDAGEFVEKLLTKNERVRPNAWEASNAVTEWKDAIDGCGLGADGEPERPQFRGKSSMKSLVRMSLATNMLNFKERSTFSKAMLLCVASQVDTGKLEKFNKIFQHLDVDKSGTLTVQEFVQGLGHFGLEHETVETIVDALDIDSSGEVDYSEFVAASLAAHSKLTDSAIVHAFNVFDMNRDGSITLDEMRHVLTNGSSTFKEVLPDGMTLDEALAKIDTSKDGLISYEEFQGYLNGEVQNSTPLPEGLSGAFELHAAGDGATNTTTPSGTATSTSSVHFAANASAPRHGVGSTGQPDADVTDSAGLAAAAANATASGNVPELEGILAMVGERERKLADERAFLRDLRKNLEAACGNRLGGGLDRKLPLQARLNKCADLSRQNEILLDQLLMKRSRGRDSGRIGESRGCNECI